MERVLDVRQGELCWIVGTVYMDMPLKPNVLDDIGKEVRLTNALLPTTSELPLPLERIGADLF